MDSLLKLYLSLMARMSSDEEGQGLVEYALIIALVSIMLIAALEALTGGISRVFAAIVKAFPAA